ncbi:putative oxoglutarate/iron-dependent dioxygenase, non-hem dioxygenase domain-containing protein [Acrodontium crateriforme]|uniref:Oxoglutarate/iron-dependent dioxygenase, non-hem dioxygenase domain-containing protein n=1 Tax=Acrodontium crateriforme TaxID=150365 RepID=A0AAQ3M1C0_9PEZI|nr:putative oxoglutarate/iron-dependent dioxygenase, non-hem dioxygenase domain-containing protein [Acrodontium crateriforme]
MANITIPVIDISSQNPSAPTQLLEAVVKYGFVFIENNAVGIPPSRISELFNLSQEFFASPQSQKAAVSITSNKAGANHGWLGPGIEKLSVAQARPDCKEAFNMSEPLMQNGKLALQQPLPESLQPHEGPLIEFQNACHALCVRVLGHFATALGVDSAWFAARHDRSRGRSGTVFRMLYYPYLEGVEDGVDVRAGAHSDYGSMTLLFQMPGQPGLEIKTPEGAWAPVPVDPSRGENSSPESRHEAKSSSAENKDDAKPLPILVNIGDLLEDWTGGLLKSTVHRVIFPQGDAGDRYSMAYFLHPLDDAALEPVPSELVAQHAAKTGRKGTKREGKTMTARDHLMERLAATYKV